MFADGRLAPAALRILDRTPSYTDYVWAAPADLPAQLRERIVDALLALSPRDDDDDVLRPLGAEGFLPAGMSDFVGVERALASTPAQATQGER